MKNPIFFVLFTVLFSCGKDAVQIVPAEKEIATVPYDTTAIDSFSVGATSVDVARQIKISSLKYQDSLKKIAVTVEEDRLLNKALVRTPESGPKILGALVFKASMRSFLTL